MGKDLNAILRSVEILSREIGDWMRLQKISASDIEFKSLNNLVSYVDKEAEKRFVERLSQLLPEAGFIAEEGSGSYANEEYAWVIDPLDGTTNFIHGIPIWCTSVALLRHKTPLVGVIYDPNQGELFSAAQGQGAWLNGQPIRVSSTTSLAASLLATGFPYDDFGRQKAYMLLLEDLCQSSRGIRRIGSAAVDLAWTACGRFEAFYEYGLNPWDVAAGALIVEEAGGTVTGFSADANPIFGEEILATNGRIHQVLHEKISYFFKG